MARVVRRRVLFCAAAVAGFGGAALLASQPLKADTEPPSRSSGLGADADISRLTDYLTEINGKESASQSAYADSVDDVVRLQNYLRSVKGRKDQSSIVVAQGGKDDLLTPGPSAPG